MTTLRGRSGASDHYRWENPDRADQNQSNEFEATEHCNHLNLTSTIDAPHVTCVTAGCDSHLRAPCPVLIGSTPMIALHKIAAVWCVAFAAIIPVSGLGMHAWFAAFELPCSASLFAAKHQALVRAATHLQQDSGNVPATLRHICQVEHFLEHEHREWPKGRSN